MNLDAMCAAALARMRLLEAARIEQFERESRERYLFTRRSMAQQWRRLREELLNGR